MLEGKKEKSPGSYRAFSVGEEPVLDATSSLPSMDRGKGKHQCVTALRMSIMIA